VVEGIVFQIRVEERNPKIHPYLAPGKNTLRVTANRVDCWLGCYNTETASKVRCARSPLICLLIDRRYVSHVGLVYDLLLLEWSEKQGETGTTARRGGLLSLHVVEGDNRRSYQEVMRGLFGDGLLYTTFLILE
jgi:hypothetical protein